MLFNFDYFVERGTILTEMARPVNAFKDARLNKLYQDMRSILGKGGFGETRSSSIDLIVWPYLYQNALDYVTPEQEKLWASAGKNANLVKAYGQKIINTQINNGTLDVDQYIHDLSDMDNLRAYYKQARNVIEDTPEKEVEVEDGLDEYKGPTLKKLINTAPLDKNEGLGGRAKGFINDLKTLNSTPEEYRQLLTDLDPIIKKMMIEMRGRKTSRVRRGEKSKYNISSVSPISDEEPDMTYTVCSSIEQVLSDSSTKYPVLINMLKDYEDKLDRGEYTSSDDFISYIDDQLQSSDPDITIPLKLLRREFREQESIASELDDPESEEFAEIKELIDNSSFESSLPKGVDVDLYSKYLNTPELLSKYKRLYELNKGLEDIRNFRKEHKVHLAELPKERYEKSKLLKDVQNRKSLLIKQIGSVSSNERRKELEDDLREVLQREKELIDSGHDRIVAKDAGDESKKVHNKASAQAGGVQTRIEQIQKELNLLSMSDEDANELMSTIKRDAPDYSYTLYHLRLPPHKKQQMIETLSQELEDLQGKHEELSQAEMDNMPDFEEDDEAFGYMTEQFQKDKKFSGKAKQVLLENNYKRFQNYHQWLTFNS